MTVFLTFLAALYYALPMYIANMAPVLVSRIPLFAVPLDFGHTWRSKPILGSHKTWRGLIAGVLAGVLTSCLQGYWLNQYAFWHQISLVDYNAIQPVYLGALLGFGAMAGDAVKSFFKRRFSIASGRPWVPFDQVDFVLGGLLLSALHGWPGLLPACIILVFTPVLHVTTNVVAYALGIKSVPW